MKILYVHGIGSNGKGNTVTMMKKYLTNHEIYSFDIPADPDGAIKFIKDKCNELDINVLVGTSLGGFYTMTIPGVQKILINPAIKAHEVVSKIGYGTHEYFCDRDDGVQTYEINDVFTSKLKNIYENHFKTIDEEMIAETYGIFGTDDNLCKYSDVFESNYRKSHMVTAKFGHRMTKEIFDKEFTELFHKVVKDFKERVW